MPARDELVPSLRSALKHLYDPVVLPQSPLIPLLGLSDTPEPVSQLRQTLVRAVRSLQPEAGIPADTQAWRLYEILLYRYIQRLSQLEVADQLGVSIRHLGRLEGQALQVLAERLRQDMRVPPSDGVDASGRAEQSLLISDELPWLAEADTGEAVQLEPILVSVVELAQPMARQHGVTLDLSVCPDLSPLAVHPVALRQILLSLLGAVIRQAPGEHVLIAVKALERQVAVQMSAPRSDGNMATESGEAIAASLQMAARLAATCGGGVTTGAVGQALELIVTLPATEQTPVLVIDDNVNTLRLLQRYASSTRYRVIPAATLSEGLTLARETAPCIIVLDVMMPEVDGWEVLGRLRQHPLTAHIPVVVCTILAEEELALSLGASGFMRKPVSREAFLAALDRVCPVAQGSH